MNEDGVHPATPAGSGTGRSGANTTLVQGARIAGAIAVVLATAAVTMPTGLTSTVANTAASLSGSAADGIWQADGSGVVVLVRHGRLWAYDMASADCLPGPTTGRQSGRPGSGWAVRFVDEGGKPLLTIRPEGAGTARMAYEGSTGDLALRRLPALPAGCPGGAAVAERDHRSPVTDR